MVQTEHKVVLPKNMVGQPENMMGQQEKMSQTLKQYC